MDYEALKQMRNTQGGHADDIGLKIVEVSEGKAVGELEVTSRLLNPYGAIHGGILFSMADTVGGTAAWTRGFCVVTSTGTINYLRGTHGAKKLIAEATEVKPGKTLSIYDVEIKDEKGRLVAKAVMTYYSMGIPWDELGKEK